MVVKGRCVKGSELETRSVRQRERKGEIMVAVFGFLVSVFLIILLVKLLASLYNLKKTGCT